VKYSCNTVVICTVVHQIDKVPFMPNHVNNIGVNTIALHTISTRVVVLIIGVSH